MPYNCFVHSKLTVAFGPNQYNMEVDVQEVIRQGPKRELNQSTCK